MSLQSNFWCSRTCLLSFSMKPALTFHMHTCAHSAESLEHFHLFHRPSFETSSPPESPRGMLPMHSDMGLFIIMTPAEYVSSVLGVSDRVSPEAVQEPSSGLRLELANGQVVEPCFPKDSLLVMNGEGSRLWVRALPTAQRPYAPAHDVLVPDMVGWARAWYGRM
jgi:hypothetical protein